MKIWALKEYIEPILDGPYQDFKGGEKRKIKISLNFGSPSPSITLCLNSGKGGDKAKYGAN